MNEACDEVIECLEVLCQATCSVHPSESPLDDPALRQDDNAFDLAIRAFDNGDPDPAGLIGGALGLVTGISAIDRTPGSPRDFSGSPLSEGAAAASRS